MIGAILAGTKSQTRRIATHRQGIQFLGGKGEEDDLSCWGYFFDGPDQYGYAVLARGLDEQHDHGLVSIPCPYGEVGDRLIVRETWSPDARTVYPCEPFIYRADFGRFDDPALGAHNRSCAGNEADCYGCVKELRGFRWRPSIHMPRAASRITLEISDVRVERLQSVSETDAVAEGVSPRPPTKAFVTEHALTNDGLSAREVFRDLWDSINGSRAPWSANCWVWSISFKRVQP
jgi:hypothetical protein